MENSKERIVELLAMLVDGAAGSTSVETFMILAEHAKREILSLQNWRRDTYGSALDRGDWSTLVSSELRRRAEGAS